MRRAPRRHVPHQRGSCPEADLRRRPSANPFHSSTRGRVAGRGAPRAPRTPRRATRAKDFAPAERAATLASVYAVLSILVWAFTVLSMPILFAGALVVFLLTFAFDRRRVLLHLYGCLWASIYVWVNPLWRSRVVGRERLPWTKAAVLVANHNSLVDILVLYGLFRPFKWVSKSSNFRIPFVGWNMVLNGYVPLTRGAADSVRRMMARCQELLAMGAPVLLFPEGTRSVTGALQPFKDGAFRLARQANVPVIPVAVFGTYETLPKHGFLLRNRMRSVVEVLDPIDPARYASTAELRDAARSAIAAALERRGAKAQPEPAAAEEEPTGPRSPPTGSRPSAPG